MPTGTFTKFFVEKGYGFVKSPNSAESYFAHIKNVEIPPGQYPEAGDEVTFQIGHGRDGREQAINIKLVRGGRMPAKADEQPRPEYPDGRGGWHPEARGSGDQQPAEPSALERDRARVRRDRGSAERDNIWRKPGIDDL